MSAGGVAQIGITFMGDLVLRSWNLFDAGTKLHPWAVEEMKYEYGVLRMKGGKSQVHQDARPCFHVVRGSLLGAQHLSRVPAGRLKYVLSASGAV